MKEKKKIGIWTHEEVKKIRDMINKVRELDNERNIGRVFIARAIAAFYSPKRSLRLLEALVSSSEQQVIAIYDLVVDDILKVEHTLFLSGKESIEELWNIASVLSTLTGVKVEKVKSGDEVFSRLYVLGRLSFLLYKLQQKQQKKKESENLLPHRGRKVTPSREEFADSKVMGCSTCRYRPLEAGDRSKKCSDCQAIGAEGIGSNWEPMSAVEKAEMLSYYGEECDYGDIFEETVVDSILSLMESHGGYLPPLADEEFWAMSPESE